MENASEQKCIVCGSKESSRFLDCTDNFVTHEDFRINVCNGCGFRYTADAPSQEEIGRYYKSEDYISHSDTDKGLINKLYHVVRNIMLGRKCRLICDYANGKKLLDIGCGTGYFLNYMKSREFECEGIEIDESARNFGVKNFGLTVNSPEALFERSSDETFDVITLWHVLEHLYGPDNYMRKIYSLLKKDGLLLIALPNCSSFDAAHYGKMWAAYDVPRHLWHFTPDSLERYLDKFGFALVKIRRLPFDAYYNSMMSAKYAGSKCSLLSGFFNGLRSNCVSLFRPEKTSSVIYIIRKK